MSSAPMPKLLEDPFPTLFDAKVLQLRQTPTSDPNYEYAIRKAWYLEWARENYAEVLNWPHQPKMVTARGLDNGNAFDISPTVLPKYFENTEFNQTNSPRKPNAVDSPYSYKAVAGYKANLWVDFANARLGGGAFVNGLAQEETMVLESPELANAVASGNDYVTRRAETGDGVGVREGSPRPLVVQGVNRTIRLTEPSPRPTDRYWWTQLDKDSLRKYVEFLPKDSCGIDFDVLAMAAPDLRRHVGGKSFSGTEIEVVQDLFNTFVAGFVLAAGHMPQVNLPANDKVLVHTGGIGTGIFGNDKVAVVALQCLAAQHVGGVDLTFYMVDQAIVEKGRQAYADILGSLRKEKMVGEVLGVAQFVLAACKT